MREKEMNERERERECAGDSREEKGNVIFFYKIVTCTARDQFLLEGVNGSWCTGQFHGFTNPRGH
jgi:hypothetical protein